MGSIVNRLFGLLMPDSMGTRDAPAPRQPVRMIEGGRAAPHLCMLPVDANLPSGREIEIIRQHGRPGKRIVQFKGDGIRALRIDGTIVTREGAPLDCALHCAPGLDRIEAAAGLGPLMFDGEYIANDGFNATLAEHKAGKGDGVFWAFDVMPLADWRAGRCDMPVEERVAMLRDLIVGYCDSHFVGMLDAWELDAEQTAAKVREIWAAGGEGIVSKRIGSPYIRNRSDDWLRVKETITVDGAIVDMMAGADGKLKSIIVRTDAGPVRIGTGWTVAEGKTLLAMHSGALTEEPIWAEISFQRSTGAKRSIRGARFHRVRASKGADA